MAWYECIGGSGGSSSHNYSTTEQVVGKWTDGKPVCELVVELNSAVTLPQNDWYVTNVPNSDKLIILSATSISSSGMCFPLGCTRDSGNTLKVWNTRSGTASCSTFIFTYVKSTS